MEYCIRIKDLFEGKIIKQLNVNGNEIILITNDGLELNYDASDGGYSAWQIIKNGKEI